MYNKLANSLKTILAKNTSYMFKQKQTKLYSLDGSLLRETKKLFE